MKSKHKWWLSSVLLLATVGVFASVSNDKAAPDFKLPGVKNETVSLSSYKGKYVVLEWTNYECPFVKKHYKSGNMQALQKEFTDKGVIWISVASSAKGKQGYYDKDQWAKLMADHNVSVTDIALDEKGKVGKKYGAKTTPHMYIISPEGKLIYQGAIDDKPTYDEADIPSSKNFVKAALDQALSGQPVADNNTKPYGCSVKY